MAEPPAWNRADSLAAFFADAETNARATAANYPKIFEFLQSVHDTLERVEQAVEKDSGWVRVMPRFLLVRAHASVLASFRLALSGQCSEATPLLRSAIEQTWYALHMAHGPDAERRIDIWLHRNDDGAATARCKSEFTVANVRQTHATLDAATATELHRLYERAIDFGAHPNQMGVLSAVVAREGDSIPKGTYGVGILHFEEAAMLATLKEAAAIAIGTIKVFSLIYPERFTLTGLDLQIPKLVADLNAVFQESRKIPSARSERH